MAKEKVCSFLRLYYRRFQCFSYFNHASLQIIMTANHVIVLHLQTKSFPPL